MLGGRSAASRSTATTLLSFGILVHGDIYGLSVTSILGVAIAFAVTGVWETLTNLLEEQLDVMIGFRGRLDVKFTSNLFM